MNNNYFLEKKQKIKSILSTPGITQQQYQRALQLLQKIEHEETIFLNKISTQQQRQQHYPSNVNNTQIIQHHTSQLGATSSPTQYKQNFETEEARLQREFELEEQKRRQRFLDEQRRRRQEYENKLQSLENNNINALDILGLGPNYNLQELKSAYKRLAIQHHPDRPSGNKDKFQLITKCYMSLLEKLKSIETSSRGHNDLKANFSSYMEKNRSSEDRMREQIQSMFVSKRDLNNNGNSNINSRNIGNSRNSHLDPKSQSFNSALFNKLYDQNKLWDPNDDGYDDWFRNGPDTEEDKPELFGDKFNLNIFNTTFNTHKSRSNNSSALVKYDEPKELVCAQTAFTEIDNTRPIDDFSKPADAPGSLAYTDLKKAYTGGCNFINPDEVDARQEYRNIEDLQKARSNINYNMSPQDRARYEARKRQEAEAEKHRLYRLQQLEQLQAQHYRDTHLNMLGYSGNPDY